MIGDLLTEYYMIRDVKQNTEIKNIKSKEIADYNENVQKEKLNYIKSIKRK